MQPAVATGGMAILLCFGITCYFFKIPEALRQGIQASNSQPYYWGAPDAEFNWCERDYELLFWVAEPVNTFSNLIFVGLPIAFLAMHSTGREVSLLAFLQVAIGVGSMAFHGSLRYPMQLLDELPMFYFSLTMAATCARRLWAHELHWPFAAVAVLLTAAVIGTPQHGLLHEAARGLTASIFASCIVVTVWGATSMVREVGAQASDKLRWARSAADRLITGSYLLFVASVLCWLGDNYYCADLRVLPAGLPYPHLHMWWHILSACAIHGLLLFFQLHDRFMDSTLSGFAMRRGLPVVLVVPLASNPRLRQDAQGPHGPDRLRSRLNTPR